MRTDLWQKPSSGAQQVAAQATKASGHHGHIVTVEK
jgi:hypothetical protein